MNSFILYLFEASLVLAVLYGLYRLLLSKETFFNFNRFFLLAILVLALLLPVVSFELVPSEGSFINEQSAELGEVRSSYQSTFDDWSDEAVPGSEVERSWWQGDVMQQLMALVIVFYGLGLTYRLFKLSLACFKIYQLKRKHGTRQVDGLNVIRIPAPMAPFSFLNSIFIPENMEDESEYHQILAHEKTHIQEKHSVDLIFAQLVGAVFWFNPVVWWLLRSLKQTHEYIADQNMMRQGFSLVDYQSLLLKQLISNNTFALVHHFNLSFIKKRMAMMNTQKSGWTGRIKGLTALFFVLLTCILIAQSNMEPGVPALANLDEQTVKLSDIQFHVDGNELSKGLSFSKLNRYKGEFSFALDNGKSDDIKIGLDLLREGNLVGHAGGTLSENASFSIKELLSKAQVNDYLVVDVIEGPSEATKLYNVPLFREGKGWKKLQASDLPPRPPRQVSLTVNGEEVNASKGLSLAEYRAGRKMEGVLRYELSEFIDMDVLEKQGAEVEIALMRKDFKIRIMEAGKVKRKGTIELLGFFGVAKPGDEVLVLFGKPDGLRFGEKFSLE